jgi:hypothetical protein
MQHGAYTIMNEDTGRGDGTMDKTRLDHRHRNKNGRLARKYGNTYIRTLRAKYGVGFAPDEGPERKLIDVLHQLDNQSLGRLVEGLSGQQIR